MQQFQILIKPVSALCNLSCTYCFYNRIPEVFPKKPQEPMSDSVLQAMVEKYLKLGFQESVFFWQGGEPTLAGLDFFKRVVKYQKKFGKNQVVGNAIQTNGIVIDEEWAKFLAEYKFLVGISLDGPEEIHDPARGKGTHAKIMNTIKLFQKYGVEFNILSVLYSGNVDKVEEIYNYLITLPTQYLQFIPALDNDPVTNKPMDYSVTPADYGEALCKIFDLWSKDAQPKFSVRIFDSVLNKMFGLPCGLCSFESKCPPYLVVENQGDVYPCDFFVRPQHKLGNLKKDSFQVMLLKRSQKFGKIKPSLNDDCIDCPWKTLCYGGCVKDRIYGKNQLKDKTYYCSAYKKFFQHSFHGFIKIVSMIAQQRRMNPILMNKFLKLPKCPCGSGKPTSECIREHLNE